jgi:hypothetical protein
MSEQGKAEGVPDMNWITAFNNINSTNAKAFNAMVLSGLYVAVALAAAWFQHPLSSETLYGVGSFCLIIGGFSLGQFTVKRFSDREYAAAKQPTQVNVEAPSNVKVTGDVKVDLPAAPIEPLVPIAPTATARDHAEGIEPTP